LKITRGNRNLTRQSHSCGMTDKSMTSQLIEFSSSFETFLDDKAHQLSKASHQSFCFPIKASKRDATHKPCLLVSNE
jgi:hypothetical protein